MKIYFLLFLSLFICACTRQSQTTVPAETVSAKPDTIINGVRQATIDEGVTLYKDLSFEEIASLIMVIPEHYFQDTASWAFTDEYHQLLKGAWDLPDDGLGDMGSNEWLSYFLSGNGDEADLFVVKSVTRSGDSATVLFERFWVWNGIPTLFGTSVLQLTKKDSKWQIADFDDIKCRLQEYIIIQRHFFQSKAWQKLVESAKQELQSDLSEYTDNVEQFFKQHPSDNFRFTNPLPTKNRMLQIIHALPERQYHVTDSTVLAPSFYALFRHLDTMPSDAVNGKGTLEESRYFLEWMEDCCDGTIWNKEKREYEKVTVSHRWIFDDIFQVSDEKSYVWACYQHLLNDSVAYQDDFIFQLVWHNGSWVLNDYSKNHSYGEFACSERAHMIRVMVENRNNLRSERWKEYVEESFKDDSILTKIYLETVDNYFRQYPTLQLTPADETFMPAPACNGK
ncbi:MAG: hypothetical protein J6P82_07185 [Bacteroidales bacterium]|nr:hypothetical protein [Bacteroidales bacterium]